MFTLCTSLEKCVLCIISSGKNLSYIQLRSVLTVEIQIGDKISGPVISISVMQSSEMENY